MSWHRHPVLSPPSPSSVTSLTLPTAHHTYKPLHGKKEEEELIRATRGQRTAGAGERVVGENAARECRHLHSEAAPAGFAPFRQQYRPSLNPPVQMKYCFSNPS